MQCPASLIRAPLAIKQRQCANEEGLVARTPRQVGKRKRELCRNCVRSLASSSFMSRNVLIGIVENVRRPGLCVKIDNQPTGSLAISRRRSWHLADIETSNQPSSAASHALVAGRRFPEPCSEL